MNNASMQTLTPAQLAEIRRLEAERRQHADIARKAHQQICAIKAQKSN